MDLQNIFLEMKSYVEDGDFVSAYELIDVLDEGNFTSFEYINVKAILFRAMGNIQDAENILIGGLYAYPDCADIYYNLGYIFYERELHVESAICFATYCRLEDNSLNEVLETVTDIEKMMKESSKLYVAFNSFRNASNQDFIFITGSAFGEDTFFLIANQMMSRYGNRIYYLAESIEVKVDALPELDEVITVIFENMENSNGIQIIRPVILQTNSDIIDTTPYILKEIKDKHSTHQHCNVICRSEVLDKIVNVDTIGGLGNQFEIVFAPADHHAEGIVSFCLYGDFHLTLNRLYNIDTSFPWEEHSLLISIVIPTRNCSKTLEHTLRTCLYDSGKDFEIVISDNSSEGNNDTLHLVQQFNDLRIKYYRPERELTLKENFEFAFCLAKGEFIFSIGSDDAVLHRGLETLREVLKQYPDQDVIVWDRLMYMWPGVGKGQDDLLAIPSSYRSGNVQAHVINCNDYLAAILNLQLSVYFLPMFYINSGFRRRYIGTIIEKTGKFIDGGSQDIYTGLINYALNEQLLHIKYPITVAGMSNQSIGMQATKMLESSTAEEEYKKKNRQISNQRAYATKVFPVQGNSDKWLLFSEYAKICQKNISPNFKLHKIDWKLAYSSCVELLSETDPSFKDRVREFEESAAALGNEDFLEWFKESYSQNSDFKGTTYIDIKEKIYLWGVHNDGSLILDASFFNISNVYDACSFMYKLYRI
ncbi:glycosyltransferase family 2 protein [Paenibacillus sp. 1011MAR3C5]|uniref:glycosyltransferase family 2 protein n=1 Tax=Paenibacillus sp. 1011MAR3C5 TaxID=1675787 RepID=UPI000E6C63DC|nr:glycosyltransferase [Paenibacillus sp. 1011MAR3C5]RJE85643.1 glycosyltransferase family 2 protein [Paenibacillus sp. 1011MAR3C5]